VCAVISIIYFCFTDTSLCLSSWEEQRDLLASVIAAGPGGGSVEDGAGGDDDVFSGEC
jgi:hypothetical protein